ncbi:alpha-L-fucosidase-like isoform X2 [Ornithodoros turicata]|uniref:alpha-L-fucosidase-like isoform X2 n=1 Tax=Ornithodoros turicata TaxID=34597 RepID=UPI0031392CC2
MTQTQLGFLVGRRTKPPSLPTSLPHLLVIIISLSSYHHLQSTVAKMPTSVRPTTASCHNHHHLMAITMNSKVNKKIPRHVGISGNEGADRTAAGAHEHTQRVPIILAREDRRYLASPDPRCTLNGSMTSPPIVCFTLSTVFHRMRLNVAFTHLIGVGASSLCSTCGVRGDLHNILLVCGHPVRETVVVNDRWGINANCKHGDFYNCKDNYDPGVLMSHKWERCTTIDMKSWGYRRHASAQDYLTIEELLRRVVKTISCNGNILINVGPTKDGVITPVFQERLLQLGSWLKVNGEGLYASKPWKHQNDSHTPGVWYTQKADNVFAYVLQWPKGNVLTLHSLKLNKASRITLLGYDKGDLAWYTTPEGAVAVEFPAFTPYALPCQWAWTLKIQGAM